MSASRKITLETDRRSFSIEFTRGKMLFLCVLGVCRQNKIEIGRLGQYDTKHVTTIANLSNDVLQAFC